MKNYDDIKIELNVTDATIRNWIKTGVIPTLNSNEKFSVEEYFEIIQNIKTKHGKLKSRVNRSYNESFHFNSALEGEGNNNINSVVRKIYSFMTDNTCSLNFVMFLVSIILLEQRELIVCHYGRQNLRITSENKQFTFYLNNWLRNLIDFDIRLFDKFPEFKIPENEIDFLGRIYESLRTVSDRSQKGAYFTPNYLVQDINVQADSRIFDPCSGTGSIIMSVVSKSHKPQSISLQDVDKLALNIALVNFVLFFENVKDLVNICHASSFDSKSFAKYKFDIIITNPPYGAKLPLEEKEKLVADYPDLLTSESFSIVLYNSIKRLRLNKKLIFILPESILYVSTHKRIRDIIFSKNYSVKIRFYGKAFKGVMSNIIRLEIIKGERSCLYDLDNVVLNVPTKLFHLNKNIPPYVKSQKEIDIIEQVFKAEIFNLNGKCEFGLGIVTGNNSNHLLINGIRKKTNEENIFTGKELKKFRFLPAKYHIDHSLENLQQVAPLRKYRSPKICYSFISNSIRTLYDNEGSLVLNSINFFIVNDPNISPKALSAFLNSSIVTFLYQKMFNSTKVLKSHIESLPIPSSFFEKTKELENIYELGFRGEGVQNELDSLCDELFGLSLEYRNK